MSKKSNSREFNLLLPSLALSALVFLLAIVIAMNSSKPTNTQVSADNPQYLSKNDDLESLQNDLLLLKADGLDEEVAVINQTQK